MAVEGALSRRPYATAAAAAALYLALHIPFLSWAPDDIDGTNFLLALREYDLREHQPHPPGYPVFVAMAHVVRAVLAGVAAFAGAVDRDTISLLALSACSALFGALAVFPLLRLWTAIDGDRRTALLASVLAMASPLYWYTGVRPLSDLPGMAFALAALALIVPAVLADVADRRAGRLFAAAVIAGIAVGVRSQTAWITGPALLGAAAAMLWRRDLRATLLIGAGLAAGLTIWVVPLLLAAGGWRTYVDLLTAQAASDFRGAILAVSFSARQGAFALRDTFVLPWGTPWLAIPILALALAGATRLLRERPRALLLIAAIFTPYLVLHLLFQSTDETRYAIPLVIPVAWLAAQALGRAGRPGYVAGLAVVGAAVVSSMGPVVSQARSGSPLARAWADIEAAMPRMPTRPAIGMHHAVARQLRFVPFSEPPLHAPARYEWLAVVDHFRGGDSRPVWFLANARRTDLALLDPAAVRRVREYRWDFAPQAVLGGARPAAAIWYEITRPGWMAGEGWALTPETRGVSQRSHRSPFAGGTVAYIARRREAATLMIGGRNLGGPCGTSALLRATLDGSPLAEWKIPAGEPFVFFADLPSGVLDGPSGYAELRLRAAVPSGSGSVVDVALEQFDVQSGRKPVLALAQGWYEPELESTSGESWRWAGQRAVMIVRNFERDVVIAITADDPTRTLGRGMVLQVRAGGRIVANQRFDHKVLWKVPIAADVIKRAGGTLTLISDAAFIPSRSQRNGDDRELSLRVLDIDVGFGEGGGVAGGTHIPPP
jgi:hypothetical protein